MTHERQIEILGEELERLRGLLKEARTERCCECKVEISDVQNLSRRYCERCVRDKAVAAFTRNNSTLGGRLANAAFLGGIEIARGDVDA